MGRLLVPWRVNQQDTITTSSTEVELLSLANAAKVGLSWKRIVGLLVPFLIKGQEDVKIDAKGMVNGDSAPSLGLRTKPHYRPKSSLRYVDLNGQWAWGEVLDGHMAVNRLATG